MREKTFGFLIAGIFAFIFLTGIISAFSVSESTIIFTKPETSKNIVITNSNEGVNLTFTHTSLSIQGDGGSIFSFNIDGTKVLNGVGDITWTISNATLLDYSKFKLGKEYSGSFIITANSGLPNEENKTITVKIENTYCDYGKVGGNDIEILEIRDEKLGNSKEWEWKPLDEISLRIRVKNNLDSRERITVAIKLYSVKDNSFIDLDGKNDELEETIRMGSGDREYFYFKFKLPVEDLEEGKYILFTKAFVDGEEDTWCYSSSQTNIDVEFEEDMVIDELETLIDSSCGQSQEISFRVYNLNAGDEEEFRVRIINRELEIDWYSQKYELDEARSRKIIYNLEIPENADEKTYKFDVVIEYDYRESTDSFRKFIDGEYSFSVSVSGSCVIVSPVSVSAVLQEGGNAGKPLVIKATIKNIGDKSSDYVLNIANYAQWAQLSQVSQNALVLAPGQSEEVLITFNVNSDVSGEKVFSIEVFSEGNLIANQPVSVSIQRKSGFFGITGLAISKDNWQIWGIGFLNLILVIIIIIVAIRIARR